MINQDFVSENIRLLFRESGLTRKELEDKTHMSRAKLRAIMAGAAVRKRSDVVAIAKAFDISLRYPDGGIDFVELDLLSKLQRALHFPPLRRTFITLFCGANVSEFTRMQTYFMGIKRNPP